MKKIKLLLIEDNRLLREGIMNMLAQQPDMKVVASARSNDTLLRVKKLNPNVVLLDMGLRGNGSLRVVDLVRKEAPQSRVIVMDLAPLQSELVEFVRAGVSGFILKDASVDDFLRTIRSVASGTKVLPPPMTGSLFAQIVEHATRTGSGSLLSAVRMTKRERDVVELIAEGLSNKEIGIRLSIATDTVKSHVHNILEKLALRTRLEIASFAHGGSLDQ